MIYFISSLAVGFIQGNPLTHNEKLALILRVRGCCFALRTTRSKSWIFERGYLIPSLGIRKFEGPSQYLFTHSRKYFLKVYIYVDLNFPFYLAAKNKSPWLGTKYQEMALRAQCKTCSLGMRIWSSNAVPGAWGTSKQLIPLCSVG